MTEGRQPFTAEIKTLAKGPSTYDPLENDIDVTRTSLIPAARSSLCASLSDSLTVGLRQIRRQFP
jgi:hypothetical protein